MRRKFRHERCAGHAGLRICLEKDQFGLLARSGGTLRVDVTASRPQAQRGRQQLLDEVWGAEPDVYSNVVDLYVHYLRKKFEEAGYDELIQTVRGIGYRLAENAKAEKPKGEKR